MAYEMIFVEPDEYEPSTINEWKSMYSEADKTNAISIIRRNEN
jgi:hypothetical protein